MTPTVLALMQWILDNYPRIGIARATAIATQIYLANGGPLGASRLVNDSGITDQAIQIILDALPGDPTTPPPDDWP